MELVFIVIIKNTKNWCGVVVLHLFFSKKLANKKNGPQENISKKNLKTYRRDDYVKSVKKIYTNKKHTHKKNKRLLADDLKKEKIREIDTEKKNTTIKKIYTQIQNTQKIPYW